VTVAPSLPPPALGEGVAAGALGHYEIVRRIGAGGMGVVYEAVDGRTGQRVALKTLLQSDPASLHRFKQEFRTLADVHHRNLVRLHELVVTETGTAFFTMELVEGQNFLEYVREGATEQDEGAPTTDLSARRHQGGAQPTPAENTTPSHANLEKLRPALRQLVEGLRALHRAGKLHCDVKPSNVLVTREGRVVLVDFGIAQDLRAPLTALAGDREHVLGTPRYMSPEQAVNGLPTPASDLYSVGVVLYEALVGRPPFDGTGIDVLTRKATLVPASPGHCLAGIPHDLDDLCMGLLQIDPTRRLEGRGVLRALGATGTSPSGAPAPGGADRLVGRAAERQALRDAFETARAGRAITVRVSGGAGMGKSALVRSFIDDLLAEGDTNFLSARAYERECVPYKAVDGVVDALSQLLGVIRESDGSLAIPRHMRSLARLFPVLRPLAGTADGSDFAPADPQTERSRAFRALRECFSSLARRRPLVVFIDDVHWGDADSAALLVEVMRPPNPPPMTLVLTSRDMDPDASPFLVELAASWPTELQEVVVGPLPTTAAHSYAVSLLGPSDPSAQRKAQAIVREARGSPLLIEELVRSHRHHEGLPDATLGSPTLDEMVSLRLRELPADVRRLAETIAVAGRPLPVATLAVASGLAGDSAEALGRLQAQGLAQTGFRNGHEVAEPAHDRIRQTVVEFLSPASLKEHHTRLAAALESVPGTDLEALALHLLHAGRREEAASAAERAAEQAASKLAFEQAARLLRMALNNTDAFVDAQRLRVRLAETLVRARRSRSAAEEFAIAARSASGVERVELERAAAEQLLWCGDVDEGKVALGRVLAAAGMRAPRSAVGAVLLLLFYRLWLRIRGLRVQERDAAAVSPADRLRIDALRSVSAGLGTVDVILGACMQWRHLLAAMSRGDRAQQLSALELQIIQYATTGKPERERQATALALGLASGCGADAQAHLSGTLGVAMYMRGRYREALARLDEAVRTSPGSPGAPVVRLFAIYSCFFLGQLRAERRRAMQLLREVDERGDVYTAVSLRSTVLVDIALADDEPEAALRHLREGVGRWSRSGFHVQHWYAMWSEVSINLYRGEYAEAVARLKRDARALRRSFLLHSEMIRGFTAYLRGCCAIASIASEPGLAAGRVAEARREVRRLRHEKAVWGPALAGIVDAAAKNAAGDRRAAVASLRDTLREAEQADLALHAWAVRYQLGTTMSSEEGRSHVAEAERAMGDEGIRSPARMAAMLVPGRWS
jgi:eukaryotic-like serine/threonine-protein kinase